MYDWEKEVKITSLGACQPGNARAGFSKQERPQPVILLTLVNPNPNFELPLLQRSSASLRRRAT